MLIFQTNKYISLWDNGNRENVTVDLYMKGVNAMKSTAFVALSDGETPKNCPGLHSPCQNTHEKIYFFFTNLLAKRLTKSVVRTLDFLDDTLRILTDVQEGSKPMIFGSIQGGYDEELRKKSVEQTMSRFQ